MRPRYKLRFTMRFYRELERIFGYIALRSPHQARRTVARILREVEVLKWFPHRSVVESEESAQPLRRLPIPPFVAFLE